MLGRVLAGRFTILARLGAGSMGTVYRARQAPMGREIALKILRSDRSFDEGSRARFLREARANSLLTSPHTVTVFDFGQTEEGEFFLAMELLEGESLGQRIRRLGRVDVDATLEMARQALRSLSEAHAKGIVHRDLKPDNLFFARVSTKDGYEEIVKVLDFGIAKMLNGDDEAMSPVETQAGTVFGTPRYMSPEQAQGKPLDPRTDLYSLGVILYHMLSGRPPFADEDAIVVMAHHIKTAPPPIRAIAPDAGVPREVDALVQRALSKDPAARFESAEAMAVELARVRERLPLDAGAVLVSGGAPRGRSVPAARLAAALGAGAALALIAGAALWAAAPASSRPAPAAGPPATALPPPVALPQPSPSAAASPGPVPGAPSADPEPITITVPASALPRSAPPAPAPRARTPPPARPAGSAKAGRSVGYGYLE
jgi:serine/threonine-protein kinase